MNYNLDVGPNGFILGLLYLLFKYFAPLIITGIILVVVFVIGRHYYRKYEEKKANEPLLIQPKESWLSKFLNGRWP